jgi:hypothetical protein
VIYQGVPSTVLRGGVVGLLCGLFLRFNPLRSPPDSAQQRTPCFIASSSAIWALPPAFHVFERTVVATYPAARRQAVRPHRPDPCASAR